MSCRSDRIEKQDLEQTRPDKPFRRNRRATEISVKRLKFSIETGERVIDHLSDLAQWVSRRDALFQIDIAEQRPARLVRPAHLHPRRYRAEDESCSQIVVEAGLFQHPAKAQSLVAKKDHRRKPFHGKRQQGLCQYVGNAAPIL